MGIKLLRMKHWNTNTYLISILLFWACCKDKESQKTTINPLFGKIRHIFEYSDSLTDIQRYFYLYDSTSGELQKIILKSHLISDSSILWMTFNKQNDTTLLVNYLPEYPQHENYKIILHLKQLKGVRYET